MFGSVRGQFVDNHADRHRLFVYAPRATGDMGRASGPTGRGKPQYRSRTATARRRPVSACRAIGRNPTRSDLVGCSSKCSPSATSHEVVPPLNRHKAMILCSYSSDIWKLFRLLQQYPPSTDVASSLFTITSHAVWGGVKFQAEKPP